MKPVHAITDKDRLLHREQERFKELRDEAKPALSDIDRAIIGGSSARLDIPLTSLDDLRRVPDLLRGLASEIEVTMQLREIPPRSKLSAIGDSVRAMRLRLRDIAGREKFNKNGTVKR